MDEEEKYMSMVGGFLLIISLFLLFMYYHELDKYHALGSYQEVAESSKIGGEVDTLLNQFAESKNMSRDDLVLDCKPINDEAFGLCFVRPKEMSFNATICMEISFDKIGCESGTCEVD